MKFLDKLQRGMLQKRKSYNQHYFVYVKETKLHSRVYHEYQYGKMLFNGNSFQNVFNKLHKSYFLQNYHVINILLKHVYVPKI